MVKNTSFKWIRRSVAMFAVVATVFLLFPGLVSANVSADECYENSVCCAYAGDEEQCCDFIDTPSQDETTSCCESSGITCCPLRLVPQSITVDFNPVMHDLLIHEEQLSLENIPTSLFKPPRV